MNETILKKIESFGDVFKKEYRSDWSKEKLIKDWTLSLQFFYDHSFMRGRRDALSIRFKELTINVLRDTIFKNLNYDLELLNNQLAKEGVNNKADRIMVIESIRFIKEIKDNNLTTYFVEKLKIDEQEAYNELIENIKYVGDKITTLYFRELCWMFGVNVKDQKLIFPIDTWVKQIINRLNILDKKRLSKEKLKRIKDSEVKEKAVDICIKYNIDPTKFNAGIWYIGTHSLEIVLKNLEKISV